MLFADTTFYSNGDPKFIVTNFQVFAIQGFLSEIHHKQWEAHEWKHEEILLAKVQNV